MTWKAGDTVSLPFALQTAAGVPVTVANFAAFSAAGWSLTWYAGASALSSQPSYTVAPIGSTGVHALTFVLPSGVDHVLVNAPNGMMSNPSDYILVTPAADIDSLASQVAAAVGGTLPGSSIQSAAFTTIEGDAFAQSFTVPATALQVMDASLGLYQYTDLSDIGGQPWTIAAQARGPWNQLPASAVDFSYTAKIVSKTVPMSISIGFIGANVPVTGAVVKNADGTADTTGSQASTSYLYDIQLLPPVGSTYAGSKLTIVSGTHTIVRQQTTTP